MGWRLPVLVQRELESQGARSPDRVNLKIQTAVWPTYSTVGYKHGGVFPILLYNFSAK
jgi:hypothetical protein